MAKFLFPAAVGHVVSYLNTELGVPVVDRSPATGTKKYVRVRRTGGVQTNRVMETAQFTLDVYDVDNHAAETFAEEVRATARTLVGTGTPGFNCTRYTEYSGPQDTPDPDAPTMPRFRFTFALHLKGTTQP